MDPTADLDILFSDLAVSATIKETAKADKPINVLFDRQSLGEMGVLTDKPQATLKESDLVGVTIKTATLTVAGETYHMTKPLPDGAGLVIVGLQRA